MANIRDSLQAIVNIEGVDAAALVDPANGMTLGYAGGNEETEIEAAANIDLFKTKVKVIKLLGRKDGVEELLITTWRYYVILRQLSATVSPTQPLLMFVKLRRQGATGVATNLAMAKFQIRNIEENMVV